jgi:hypothetical protein
LRYHLTDSNRFQLIKAICEHRHVLKRCRNFKYRAVQEYIEELPAFVSVTALKSIICPQFSISEKQLYYLIARSNGGRSTTIEELTNILEKQGYDIFQSEEARPREQPPELLIAVFPDMKNMYQLYGDVVSFDFTFNLIKDNHPSGSCWKMGLFFGDESM